MAGPAGPDITSPANANAIAGLEFSYQTTSSPAFDSVAASGLPRGLSMNTATGLITGIPLAKGVITATLTAHDIDGPGTPFSLHVHCSVQGKITVVENTGADRFIGYLPPHGRFMAHGDAFAFDGDLRTALMTRKRYSSQTALDAITFDLANDLISLDDLS